MRLADCSDFGAEFRDLHPPPWDKLFRRALTEAIRVTLGPFFEGAILGWMGPLV